MRLIVWSLVWLCLLIRVNAIAGTLSSYTQTTTLANADRIPVVQAALTNANINWSDLKNVMSSGLNWTDIKVIGTQYGDHSGINWQSFGA